MKNLLERKLFPFVIKPGRYAGGEPGQIVKDPAGKTSYLHIYPDKYEVGQAYPGIQSLYHIVNSRENLICERAYAVDLDAEEIMRKENIPLFALESYRPAKEFDAIGFTLPYELVYTNILTMLDLAGIPIYSKDRTDDDPIIMAGGPSVYNPEPMVDFIDLFFIGDAEEGLPQILELIQANKNLSRSEKLIEIVKNVEAVYIPSLYDENILPKEDFVPDSITGSVVRELKPEYYPDHPIVPLIDISHKHLSVEIMRGCPQGCRFCMAGSIYRPVRMRPVNEILSQIEKQLENTGYDEVTLLSLSSSDYSEIEELASIAASRLEGQRISVALPSLRPGTISHKLFNAIKKVRTGGLTISPEAGSERLRLFIRKDFPDEAVYDTARMAFEKGWTSLKLYFMIGLPTETDEDLQAIINIVKNIANIAREYNGRKTINVTLSPFVPKPHTPFQWDEIIPFDEILRRINFIKKNTRVNFVNYKYPMVESSMLQGVLGRGDRRMGRVIYDVFSKGGRFDGWGEIFNYQLWTDAFEKNNFNLDELIKAIPFSEKLPWQHIRKTVSTEHLKKERQRTSQQLKEYEPKADNEQANLGERELNFGRSNKKVATRQVIAPTKNQVRFKWSKAEPLRFMGHLDNMRLMERALRIAKLPVAFSQGYNPTMKISSGPPLPLGFISDTEFIDVTFESNFMPYMAESFKAALPVGIELKESQVIFGKSGSLTSKLNRMLYSIDIKYFDEYPDYQEAVDKFMKTDSVLIERQGKKKITEIDLRQTVYDIYTEDSKFFMLLGIGDGGYGKPGEVLTQLLGADFNQQLMFKIKRCESYRIDENGNKISPMEL